MIMVIHAEPHYIYLRGTTLRDKVKLMWRLRGVKKHYSVQSSSTSPPIMWTRIESEDYPWKEDFKDKVEVSDGL